MKMAYFAIFICIVGAFTCFMAAIANMMVKKNNENNKNDKDDIDDKDDKNDKE